MMSRVMNMASVVSTWLGGSCCVPIACRNSPSTTTIRTKLVRSEEHTSELQSRLHLVCRLLLEKKKFARRHRPPHVFYRALEWNVSRTAGELDAYIPPFGPSLDSPWDGLGSDPSDLTFLTCTS